MNLDDVVASSARYGSSSQQLAEAALGFRTTLLSPRVVVAPWWEPRMMPALGEATRHGSDGDRIKLWDVSTRTGTLSWVKTGIGAPQLMDAILGLAIAGCQQVIFVGSVGGLTPSLQIGDLIVPSASLIGEGASRYLQDDPRVDPFGRVVEPDPVLTGRLVDAARHVASDLPCHRSMVFSVDSIAAQFAHLDAILELGAEAVEMETSAAFAAGAACGLPVGALLQVSDNPTLHKSLVSGRTNEDHLRRQTIRREIIPDIILQTLGSDFSEGPVS